MSVNKVILVGNLGKDPEVRYFDNQKVVANFTLATNEVFMNKNGERKVETEWHNIEMWDQLAKVAEKYLKKGALVYIEGKIKSDSWRDKDGNEHLGKKIRANTLTLLGAKSGNQEAENGSTIPPIAAPNQSPELGDDLPF
ncbi:MAG TPA: single-stranded DNA-binding protein [Bacteroidetes bacterium]|jgi:single-strand DNA-binding protein|nr:single-stranded DNA-binding protein [Bacteroidota bacterium]